MHLLVCEGVEHGAGNCSDYHKKRLAYEENVLIRCSNKQLDGSDGTPLNNETIAVLKEIHALETLQFEQQHPQTDPDMCSEVFEELLFIDGSSVRMAESSSEDVERFE
ncbi:hypothetical protein AAVH_17527 [Aphelenchoides avenae]|nr:hypothetical protein AAVH_17527 [Aphelenchus avenae]